MDKGNWKDIRDVFFTIDTIEKKNRELSNLISKIEIPQRITLLSNIYQDILNQNRLFSNLGLPKHKQRVTQTTNETLTINNFIDNYITSIEKDPTKKVIHLKEFLDFFQEISDKDKNVILKSLKDVDLDNLKDKMIKLTTIFNLSF